MEHKFIIENEIIENYLLHRLNESETDDFEEHLLYCEECREKLALTRDTIKMTQYMAIHSSIEREPEIKNLKRIHFIITWRKIAAVILLLVCCAAGVIYLIKKPDIRLVKNQEKANNVNITDDTAHINNQKPTKNPYQPVLEVKTMLIGENYKELPAFENAIKNNLRGSSIESSSPKQSQEIAFGEKVIFMVKENTNELMISVINNSGATVFENRVKMPYTLSIKLPKGLYYWEITENDEVVFVSKFLIK
jgi:hypothetical protein